MKRRIYTGVSVLLMVMLLVCLAIVGCSTKSSTTTTTQTTTTTTTQVAQEVLKLKFSCDFQAFEPPGINGVYFCDTLEQLSGGTIKVDRFLGGQLGTAPEQLGLVKSGAVDIATFFTDQFPAELPLHSIMPYDTKSKEYVVEKMHKLWFTIPETSALFQAEQTKQNIKILNIHCIGESGILSKEVATTFDELKGKKIGMFLLDRGFEALGLVHVTVQVPEQYEALSRGVIDCVCLPPGPEVALKMYELCKSYTSTGTYTAAIPIVVNLEMWNKLTAEQQEWFKQAAAASQTNSVKVDTEQTEGAYQAFRDAGLVVTKLPQADVDTYFSFVYKYNIEDTWMSDCTKAGVDEQAKIIKKHFDELTTFGASK